MLRYTIDPDSDIPVYRQLTDQINAEIRSGVLPTGTQLPTVREMAERMELSCGTVKRVYDRLREMGDIEMTRRRGSFVKYVRADQDNRKLQAMNAIDRMIRQLSELDFSPAEIQIFLGLKMREWGLKWSGIRIALVNDMPELEPSLERRLSAVGNVKIIFCATRQLREYPYSIDEESDVILASIEDSQRLSPILPDRSKLIKVAFRVAPESIRALAALEGSVGVLCEEDSFARLAMDCLHTEVKKSLRIVRVGEEIPEELDHLIVPPDWRRYGAAVSEEKTVTLDYGIDEGSMIYLEERISRIRDERQLQPGALRF